MHPATPSTHVELWLATQNPKKLAELERLVPHGIAVHTLAELPEGAAFTIVEDAPDFRGNAEKKAAGAAAFLREAVTAGWRPTDQVLVLADDSGLCVDALDGRPGVHSARYAGESASDADRVRKLLGELGDTPAAKRTARFVCCLVVCDLDGAVFFTTEQTCEGMIREVSSGTQGFGYDPVFRPAEIQGDISFADLTATEKDAVSHRGKALRRLVAALEGQLHG